ncbi:carboxypeptidase regulatory-like domain-containing protein [Jiangella endophytica]|uniref:carboxypeptidase regulatory-like domain-containing protein n=1 Tax=Jiangella endophytica TaxID=1623398 RepID=UPI000E34E79C|nr:carboxypeptidase-like regulatory domain-containing protein [Jiangella endophytica]
MRVTAAPQVLEATGGPATVRVEITNTGEIISGYQVRVLGADPAWVTVDDATPTLFPGSSVVVTVTLTPPPDLPAGERRLAVQVRETTPPHHATVAELELRVAAAPGTTVTLDPAAVTAGRRASFGVTVRNTGNTTVEGAFAGTDPEDRIGFRFVPASVRLAPGESLSARVEARARRPLLGSPAVRALAVRLEPDVDAAAAAGAQPLGEAPGSMVQRPVLGRGTIALAGLLAAVTVFAVVITAALAGVVNRSAADRDLAIEVAQSRDDAAGAGRATLTGTVRLITTGAPLPGVAVEAYAVDDPTAPVATTATEDDGTYVVDGLSDGGYLLRFRGAGYSDLWYPAAMDSAAAAPVEVTGGQSPDAADVALGGLPAVLAGTVEGADVSGATVSLRIPLEQLGGQAETGVADGAVADPQGGAAGAVLREVPVGSDGSFEIDGVPSPGVYDVVVGKPGYATEVQRVDLTGGEERTGITIRLREGDGIIAGEVRGAAGPIGGASVVATAGDSTARTVSLTEGDVGAFTLRNLPTPGTFTVVVAAPGHAAQTLTLDLSAGQQLTGVSVTLGTDAGELFGRVTELPGGGPATGVEVTVSDGTTSLSTVTQSTGEAGSWRLGGLPVPATYTVTFAGPGLAAQTVQVMLDAFGAITAGGSPADGVTVALHPAGADLTGSVSLRNAVDGSVGPAGNVTVTAVSGSRTYAVTSSSQPAGDVGRYVLPQLPPGTYTVTASRPGSTPAATTVTLEAGGNRDLDLQLAAPASVTATVVADDGPVAGAVVDLYRATEYGTAAAPVASVRTGSDGQAFFAELDAPEHYVVDVRLQAGAAPAAASPPFTVAASEAAAVTLNVAAAASTGTTPNGDWE